MMFLIFVLNAHLPTQNNEGDNVTSDIQYELREARNFLLSAFPELRRELFSILFRDSIFTVSLSLDSTIRKNLKKYNKAVRDNFTLDKDGVDQIVFDPACYILVLTQNGNVESVLIPETHKLKYLIIDTYNFTEKDKAGNISW